MGGFLREHTEEEIAESHAEAAALLYQRLAPDCSLPFELIVKISRFMHDFSNEVRATAIASAKTDIAKKLILQNKLSPEDIAAVTKVPLEQVEQFAQKLAVTV